MKVLFDTSVLVAATVEAHPEHERALPWLQRVQQEEIVLVIAAHSLAEYYSVVTTLPVRPRISPEVAGRLLAANIRGRATIIELTAEDYRETVEQLVELGLSGGIVYDALIARAGRRAGADRLLTLNPEDFHKIRTEGGPGIEVP